MNYLDYDTYEARVQDHPAWVSYRQRWPYHQDAIKIIQTLDLRHPRSVLEIGSFGVPLVRGSVTMDMPDSKWAMPKWKPRIRHDARDVPWPFEDGRFELVVALRVWHHLFPHQEEAFREALRAGRKFLMACPEKEIVGVGIKRDRLVEWNGAEPLLEKDLYHWGRMYLWGAE